MPALGKALTVATRLTSLRQAEGAFVKRVA